MIAVSVPEKEELTNYYKQIQDNETTTFRIIILIMQKRKFWKMIKIIK